MARVWDRRAAAPPEAGVGSWALTGCRRPCPSVLARHHYRLSGHHHQRRRRPQTDRDRRCRLAQLGRQACAGHRPKPQPQPRPSVRRFRPARRPAAPRFQGCHLRMPRPAIAVEPPNPVPTPARHGALRQEVHYRRAVEHRREDRLRNERSEGPFMDLAGRRPKRQCRPWSQRSALCDAIGDLHYARALERRGAASAPTAAHLTLSQRPGPMDCRRPGACGSKT